jgi:predicted extracellular nuclease
VHPSWTPLRAAHVEARQATWARLCDLAGSTTSEPQAKIALTRAVTTVLLWTPSAPRWYSFAANSGRRSASAPKRNLMMTAKCSAQAWLLLVTTACISAFGPSSVGVGADAADLFISEYVEGSGNNKALEIYNATGAAIDLGANAYNVQMFFNGSTSPGLTINLIGVVASGDVFVLAHSGASSVILSRTDQTNGSGWFNGNDAVVLRRGATILDAIGEVGADPGDEWGTGLLSTADNTLRRRTSLCGGDTDAADGFDPAAQWDGFATDAFDGLGVHAANCTGIDEAPAILSTFPGQSASVSIGGNLSVTFTEPVSAGAGAFDLTCATGGSRGLSVSGGPATFTLDPTEDLPPRESCTLRIDASRVSDLDDNDPPDAMAADVSITFFTVEVCTLPYTRIPAIQGRSGTAAITGPVDTEGVVIGDFELPSGSGQMRGFFIQDPAGDGDAATSDGIFVFNGNNDSVALGDLVRVSGNAGEFQEQTQITASSVVRCGIGSVAPVDVALPLASSDALETFEGMLVRLPQTLVVTDNFQLGRFGEVVVSSGGRLPEPTQVVPPGASANAQQALNGLNRIIIDDGNNLQNADPIVFGRGALPLSASNTLRAGDTITGAVGVMTYTWAGNAASGNAYRVRPVGALNGTATFQPANPRRLTAPERTGSLRVASVNLLNFFNTFGAACTNGVGGTRTDCRGADNAAELDRQWPKTVAAIVAIDADVIGVIEIENDGYGPSSALAFLIDRLNRATEPGTYAFIDADGATGQVNALGTDAVKVGLLYRASRVRPVGQTAVLNTALFVNGGDGGPRNRPALAQAFEQVGTGARFVVSVNHLKSKGSACNAPDAGDGQGDCNVVRTNAAYELAAWLARDPTGITDPDVLVIGDLNAYAMEDPLSVLTSAGYTNLVPAFGGDGSSFAFQGQWGALDHALASASLAAQVTGAEEWTINADEPAVLDYNLNFKSAGQVVTLYAPAAFRMADHNPVIVDLSLR